MTFAYPVGWAKRDRSFVAREGVGNVDGIERYQLSSACLIFAICFAVAIRVHVAGISRLDLNESRSSKEIRSVLFILVGSYVCMSRPVMVNLVYLAFMEVRRIEWYFVHFRFPRTVGMNRVRPCFVDRFAQDHV